MLSNGVFTSISDLSGISMGEAKKIRLLARDLLNRFDLTTDEETVLRLEMISNCCDRIIDRQEEIQQAIM